MSDPTEYTPTTEDVRDAYREQSDGCDFPTRQDWYEYVASGGGEGEFDRWIVEHNRALSEKRWDEGYESGVSDVANHATPSGNSIDPERNPYRKE